MLFLPDCSRRSNLPSQDGAEAVVSNGGCHFSPSSDWGLLVEVKWFLISMRLRVASHIIEPARCWWLQWTQYRLIPGSDLPHSRGFVLESWRPLQIKEVYFCAVGTFPWFFFQIHYATTEHAIAEPIGSYLLLLEQKHRTPHLERTIKTAQKYTLSW